MNHSLMIKTPLMNHQLRLVESFKSLKVGYLKGDMGTGKTLSMLALAYSKQGKYTTVIWVAPCSTIPSLRDQLKEHGVDLPIRFFSYEALQVSNKAYSQFCHYVQSCFLVLDEAHYLKNRKAKRTQRITMVAKYANYRFAMSGTPIGLDLYDYFAQLFVLSHEIWGYSNWRAFETFHIQRKIVSGSFGKREVMTTVGSYELIQRLKPYLCEFKKAEILSFLPVKIKAIVKHESPCNVRLAYDNAKEEIIAKYAEYGITQNVVYMLITALHQIVGIDDDRVKLLDELVDGFSAKTIVWCKYRAEVDFIAEKTMHKALIMDGRTNAVARHETVKQFKEGDETILITNQACGSVGLNLQFCSHQIFYNQSWCSIQRQQAEDRTHRIGQKATECHYTDIVGNMPIEQMLQACLKRKQSLKSFINDMIAKNEKLTPDELIQKFGYVI